MSVMEASWSIEASGRHASADDPSAAGLQSPARIIQHHAAVAYRNHAYMDTNNLKDTLKALHANLESTRAVDPELKELLQALDRDIRQLLDSNDAHRDSNTSGLIERAQTISAKLAVRHPHIEPALREVADMLGKMGI
jgi:hypothetical protein